MPRRSSARSTSSSSFDPAGRCQSPRRDITRCTRARPGRPRLDIRRVSRHRVGSVVCRSSTHSVSASNVPSLTSRAQSKPHAWGTGDADRVAAINDVRSIELVRPTQQHPGGDRCAVVGDHGDRLVDGSRRADVPQAGGSEAGDRQLGIRQTGGGTAGLERFGRRGQSVHAMVDAHEQRLSNKTAHDVARASIGDQVVECDETVPSGNDSGEVWRHQVHRALPILVW
jgi:hypothetical protein